MLKFKVNERYIHKTEDIELESEGLILITGVRTNYKNVQTVNYSYHRGLGSFGSNSSFAKQLIRDFTNELLKELNEFIDD